MNTIGTGRIINIAENPDARAFWPGGTKLFMNAIFVGAIIDAASDSKLIVRLQHFKEILQQKGSEY